MSRRAFRGGMIVLALITALALAGAEPASAAGHQPSWWQLLVSIWGKTGAYIDPNGVILDPNVVAVTPTAPPGPHTAAPFSRATAPRGQARSGARAAFSVRGSKG